jgi:hypothetical protein
LERVIATMTAFTATHSLTLTGATLGWVHVPQPPVEACIALSTVFVTREIIKLPIRSAITGKSRFVPRSQKKASEQTQF